MTASRCGKPPSTLGHRRSLRSVACAVFDQVIAEGRPAAAVLHPLDFVCVPIVRGRGSGVCGHIWSNGGNTSAIHAHSWHLYSEVVLGAITNDVFQVARHPGGDLRVVHVHSDGLTDVAEPAGTAAMVDGRTTEVCRSGGSYTLDVSTFHRSTPVPGELTLTLLHATTVAGRRDQVLVEPLSTIESTQRERVPEDRARRMVAMFRDAIAATTTARAGTRLRRSHVPSPPRSED